jgi:subtilase family serine protease
VNRNSTFRSFFISLLALAFLASTILPASFGYSSYNSSSSQSSSVVAPAPLIVSGRASDPSCTSDSLCPSQIQNAYGFNSLQSSGVTGKGQTIVIVDACGDPTIASDLKTFDAQFNLPNPKLKILKIQGNPSSSCTGWADEVALDVEWAHVTAPGAAIDLIVTVNAGAAAMYAAWTYALRHNLGNQISNSWGGAGCNVKPCNNTIGEGIGPCTETNGTQGVNVAKILKTAQKKGVSVLVAAGDGAAWGLGTSNEEPVPGDCQGVLTIGGTHLAVTSTGAYLGESAWTEGGGGYVTTPSEPSYQANQKIPDPYGTLAKPDVSADADPGSGVWIYLKGGGGWLVIGGTSLATPLWSGFMADVNQMRAGNHFAPAGYINAFLYSSVYANKSLYASDFHDVTSGSNGWSAGTGWDAATGLGSFIAPNLASTLGNTKSA